MSFSIVFPEVYSGPCGRILADLASMQNAPEIPDHKGSRPEQVDEPCETVPYVKPQEIGGPAGLEPTRYGDWERKGRCIDF
jgi:shikimate dehydrogenase